MNSVKLILDSNEFYVSLSSFFSHMTSVTKLIFQARVISLFASCPLSMIL